MRAAVLVAPRRVALRRVPVPVPLPGQVRVCLQGCGVCASSLPLWEGRPWFDYPRPPGAPGHEAWGTIDALGDGVTHFSLGQRVAGLSYHGFAESDVMDAEAVVLLPPGLADADFPGEALACAVNAFRRAGIEAGQNVAVVGAGFLGAILVRLACNAGARVIAVTSRPSARALAQQLGAELALSREDPAAVAAAVEALTGGNGCDVAIEATGFQGPLDLAARLLRVRGRLVIAGYHQDGPRSVDMQLWNWRGLDVVNAHERDPRQYVAGMRAAIDEVVAGRVDLNVLLTHRFPLDEVPLALETTRLRPEGFFKALVRL